MKICPQSNQNCDWELESAHNLDRSKFRMFLHRTFPHMPQYFSFWENKFFTQDDPHVLQNKNEIVAFLDVGKAYNDPNLLWINLIAIDPKYQHQKLGAQLLRAAQHIAKEKYLQSEIHLTTEWNKHKNLQFYAKNGFQLYDLEKNGYAHTSSAYFKKKIA